MFSSTSSESTWSTTRSQAPSSRYFRCDLRAHKTIGLRPELIEINDFIWWSTDCDKGEQGMVKYDPLSDRIMSVVNYTRDIEPSYHSCCRYKSNIYIVDGRNGEIICFNPDSKRFIMKLKIAKIGRRARCIVLHDEIHIFNGFRNCKHLVYSIAQNTIATFADPTTTSNVTEPCIIKYENKIIRFGGFDMKLKQFTDTLYISSDIAKYDADHTNYNDIEWRSGCKLIRGIAGCGYVIYKEYIIIFGGRWALKEYTDAICVLNLRKNNSGWRQLKHIKCPMPSQYVAVLKDDDTVHLLTAYNKNKVTKHYSIAISHILVENIEESEKDNNDDEKYNEESQQYQAKESKQQRIIKKLHQKQINLQLQPMKRKKKKQKKRMEILESIAEFEENDKELKEFEMQTHEIETIETHSNETQNEAEIKEMEETQENKVEMETIEMRSEEEGEIKESEAPNERKASEKEDDAKEEEEIEIEYILLKQWHLAQYIPILVEEMGYDDIEDWRDLTHDDLKEMKFKPGHAARFIRMTKQYFMQQR